MEFYTEKSGNYYEVRTHGFEDNATNNYISVQLFADNFGHTEEDIEYAVENYPLQLAQELHDKTGLPVEIEVNLKDSGSSNYYDPTGTAEWLIQKVWDEQKWVSLSPEAVDMNFDQKVDLVEAWAREVELQDWKQYSNEELVDNFLENAKEYYGIYEEMK